MKISPHRTMPVMRVTIAATISSFMERSVRRLIVVLLRLFFGCPTRFDVDGERCPTLSSDCYLVELLGLLHRMTREDAFPGVPGQFIALFDGGRREECAQ